MFLGEKFSSLCCLSSCQLIPSPTHIICTCDLSRKDSHLSKAFWEQLLGFFLSYFSSAHLIGAAGRNGFHEFVEPYLRHVNSVEGPKHVSQSSKLFLCGASGYNLRCHSYLSWTSHRNIIFG